MILIAALLLGILVDLRGMLISIAAAGASGGGAFYLYKKVRTTPPCCGWSAGRAGPGVSIRWRDGWLLLGNLEMWPPQERSLGRKGLGGTSIGENSVLFSPLEGILSQ